MQGFDDEDARGDEPETVGFLAELAGDGPVLEFAIGTGRIALPLAEQGLRVDGIEQSSAMVDVLRAKPGGAELAVTVGDMSTVAVPPHRVEPHLSQPAHAGGTSPVFRERGPPSQ